MRASTTVLMYHRVLEDEDCADYPFPSLVMPRSLFEAQVDYLSERTRVVPVADALAQTSDAPSDSKPVVCLTFDDGYVDNFEVAAPILEARGLRGTFFITAGAVQAREHLWYDRAASIWELLGRETIRNLAGNGGSTDAKGFETRQSWIEWLKVVSSDQRENVIATLETQVDQNPLPCSLMTSDQVRRLAETGHEIGSHTLWHPILTTMAADERKNEIEGARKLLQEWTNREVEGFCYPNGNFDAEVVRQLREVGHSYACTTQPGRNHEGTSQFELRRIDVTRDRVAAADGHFDQLGFRAEICLFRDGLRRWTA
jgi:peptidoglycan/xylan/chitin deacetylase (PgdA/CDA1 family)